MKVNPRVKNFVLFLDCNIQKKMKQLTLGQRYEIENFNFQGFTQTKIGKLIGKDKSAISRELKRNSDQRNGVYKAELAHSKAMVRHREKPKKVRFFSDMIKEVTALLEKDYSPDQIKGRSEAEGWDCVSHERIYTHVWADKKKGADLYKHLRTKGKKYRKRGSSKDSRGLITGRVDIDQRPGIVELKERIGDLEIDLVIGKGHKGALLTINDRATRILIMDKVESKEAAEIEIKTIELLEDWKPFIHTITSDNGKEFANHRNIAQNLDINFYFTKPYHSWQRGANENLNGLVRQYFPKEHDFYLITKSQITGVINILNNRPRKRFGFKTPNEIFGDLLDSHNSVVFIT
jgi:IS30 family transposase